MSAFVREVIDVPGLPLGIIIFLAPHLHQIMKGTNSIEISIWETVFGVEFKGESGTCLCGIKPVIWSFFKAD